MIFNVLDQTGHSTLPFSDDEKALAEQTFKRLTGTEKMLAYTLDKGGKAKQVRALGDVKEDAEVTFAPALQGG